MTEQPTPEWTGHAPGSSAGVINIRYLKDILSTMIEAQYWGELEIEDYAGFVDKYKEDLERESTEVKTRYQAGIRRALRGLLNSPDFDYEALVLEQAMHGMGSQERAKQLMELIWCVFFNDEDWTSPPMTGELAFVDQPLA